MNRREKRFYKDFGQAIKIARKETGITQAQLAKKLKLSRVSVVNIEAGRQGVSLYRATTILMNLPKLESYLYSACESDVSFIIKVLAHFRR